MQKAGAGGIVRRALLTSVKMENPLLSIIILSYNSREDLKNLLPSVWNSKTEFASETIVVDNGSADGTPRWLEGLPEAVSGRLKIIKNQNTGFAKGNNLGIRQALGKYLLILNPDTMLQPDTLSTMVKFMNSRPDVGIAGCRIIKPDGTLDLACRRRFPNPLNSFKRLFLLDNRDYNYSDVDENLSMEVDSVVGAFMMAVKTVADKIGPLDENFFMYGEDLDWCWRCREAGYKVWYFPQTFITHYKGSSSKKVSAKALGWFHGAMWIFYRKHYANKYPAVFNFAVWLGIYGRMAVLVAINFFKSNPRVSK